MMVEGEMNEVSEHDMLEAIKFAHEEIKKHCRVQKELMHELGTDVNKRDYPHDVEDEDLKKAVHDFCYDKCYALAKSAKPKKEREEGFKAIKEEFLATIPEEQLEEKTPLVERYYHAEEKEAMRNMILDEGIRLDGRVCDQVRPIWCEVDYLPCAHGSAIFTRGETQSLATVTLGTKMDMKEMDEVLIQEDQQFVLHYNFPPFATGEAKPQRGPGRREIGHGNLAMRALKPVIPMAPENPYAVRVVSDILESNGSSSMASVCGGCLALMDAGVKIKKPVAGVAMGLITDETRPNDRYAILTDILGDEDHLGDMDFKVTGTADGITATQMDIKVDGLSYEVLEKALEQARQGRMHIMGEMMKTISEPRADYKPFVPRIVQIRIAAEFIGAVIGKGGETIQIRQRRQHAEGTRLDQGHLRCPRGRHRLSRQGREHPRVRRVHRDPAGQGRPAARLRDRLEQDREGRGCPLRRRRSRRQAPRDRRQDRQDAPLHARPDREAGRLQGAGAPAARRQRPRRQ